VRDILYSVDLFTITELQTMPGQYNPGFNRCCVYNNQILISNEKQFFVYDSANNSFNKFDLMLKGKAINPR
jgi:hypothetical protein